MIETISLAALIIAAVTTGMFFCNLLMFRGSPQLPDSKEPALPVVSVRPGRTMTRCSSGKHRVGG